jgi:hypothetical protein
MCPHTTICVHTGVSVSYIYLLILFCVLMCPHTSYYIFVLLILHLCPHTGVSASSIYDLIISYVPSYCYICVLILLRMCPHTATYVSSYCYACVFILLRMCPHTATYVFVPTQVSPRPHQVRTVGAGAEPLHPLACCSNKSAAGHIRIQRKHIKCAAGESCHARGGGGGHARACGWPGRGRGKERGG